MGTLIRSGRSDPSQLYLHRDHTFGRDPANRTVLRGVKSSRLHARIFYQGGTWMLRDMGSRNGTYLNGQRVPYGSSACLKKLDDILFGDLEENWIFADDRGPCSMLIPLDGVAAAPILLERLVAIPSAERPCTTVFIGSDGSCLVEQESGVRSLLQHDSTITIEGIEYRVHLDAPPGTRVPDTKTEDTLPSTDGCRQARISIAVTPDEERAAATLWLGQLKHVLPPRVHLYLLAHLARLRISETSERQDDAAPAESQSGDGTGWVDCESVCSDLRINREHLAQMVFRIRQDFEPVHAKIAKGVIERHLRGKIRIGIPAGHLTVSRLG